VLRDDIYRVPSRYHQGDRSRGPSQSTQGSARVFSAGEQDGLSLSVACRDPLSSLSVYSRAMCPESTACCGRQPRDRQRVTPVVAGRRLVRRAKSRVRSRDHPPSSSARAPQQVAGAVVCDPVLTVVVHAERAPERGALLQLRMPARLAVGRAPAHQHQVVVGALPVGGFSGRPTRRSASR
jgi:hypothetical protein